MSLSQKASQQRIARWRMDNLNFAAAAQGLMSRFAFKNRKLQS
jgi:hypothetical protein